MRAQEFTPSKLVIFDIDDTLVHTQTKVHVVQDGRVVKSLNSHDFTHYKLQPGQEFDFGAFRNAREFFENSKPIIPMMNQLKQDIATGNKVVMVTARADFDDRELFLDTFRKYGVDMSKVHVYRAGNMAGKMQTEEKKKIIIRELLNSGRYTKAIMYDDAVPNLDAFLSLHKEYPHTKFYTWHVSLEGEASEHSRSHMEEDWNKVNHHDKTNGLSQKAVNAYRREHPGSKLQTAVTTKPSKLKKGSKATKRRKSFCARMSGNKGPMKKPNGKPTPKALALRRWNCESIEDMAKMIIEGEQMIAEIKKGSKDSNGFTKCWPGKHAEGTKKGKNGGRVRNCVPNESVAEGLEQKWEVSFDYGPHESERFTVKADSKEEAIAKVKEQAKKSPMFKNISINWAKPVKQGVAEGSENNNPIANKIFFARSNKTPKGWSYDHVGFITQDGKQIQMSGHKGNDVYVTNDVTDDPEFPKQNIKIVSLSKPVLVPTTNSVGAENCGTFVANVLQANGIKGIDTQKIYSVFKKPQEQNVVNEKWTQKYKNSINCSNPKGFSQKAHCAGKKK